MRLPGWPVGSSLSDVRQALQVGCVPKWSVRAAEAGQVWNKS